MEKIGKMLTLNITPHDDVGGAVNINEDRKRTIMEAIDSIYLDDIIKIKIILAEIFYEIIDRGQYKVNILMHDNDLFESISNILYNWDIDLIKM